MNGLEEMILNDTENLKIEEEREKALIREKEDYLNKFSANSQHAKFMKDRKEGKLIKPIPTGFKMLDEVLKGGLVPKHLSVLGAESSVGKTSLLMQITDNIVSTSQSVLYINLEQPNEELIAKTVSRFTYLFCGNRKNIAKTSVDYLEVERYKNYSVEELELIDRAVEATYKIHENLFLYEPECGFTVDMLEGLLQKHIKFTESTPVVFIDYFQNIAPSIDKSSKEVADYNVRKLKILAKKYNVHILVLSSLNRKGYSSEKDKSVKLQSLKESGMLEYTADTVLALQSSEDISMNKTKKQKIRKLELAVLKNRRGEVNSSINLLYDPRFNYFEEVGIKEDEESSNPASAPSEEIEEIEKEINEIDFDDLI